MGAIGIFICFITFMLIFIFFTDSGVWDGFQWFLTILFMIGMAMILYDNSADTETKSEIIITNNFKKSKIEFISDVNFLKIEKIETTSKCSICVFGEKTEYKIIDVIKPNKSEEILK